MTFDPATREMLILLTLAVLFFICGGYFGVWRRQVGLHQWVPLRGDAAFIWGMMMCGIAAILVLLAK